MPESGDIDDCGVDIFVCCGSIVFVGVGVMLATSWCGKLSLDDVGLVVWSIRSAGGLTVLVGRTLLSMVPR